ncbi:MAG: SBBP repeat-containing protein [Bacteroidetes bacterium]|nr:SBBP repeat-containing protein [Bacteroidota bacterium]
MIKRFLSVLLVTFFYFQFTTGQDFHWAKSFGSSLDDNCNNVALDNYGNTYVAGNFGYVVETLFEGYYYESTLFFYLEGVTLMNNGFDNNFLVKFDKNGALVWAKSIGGTNGHVSAGWFMIP